MNRLVLMIVALSGALISHEVFAHEDGSGVLRNVYLNDVYAFALPLGINVRACMNKANEHGVALALDGHRCSTLDQDPHLAVSGYWATFADDRSIEKEECDNHSAEKSVVHFGRLVMHRCSGTRARPLHYYVVAPIQFDKRQMSITYDVTCFRMPASAALEKRLDRIFSEVRFLEEPANE
jgi:hypothetical protein